MTDDGLALRGCLTEVTKADDAPNVSPADMKADWFSDLPLEPSD